MKLTFGQWLLGWVLVLTMIGVGVWRDWLGLMGLGLIWGLFWFFAPTGSSHEDPPEDIR